MRFPDLPSAAGQVWSHAGALVSDLLTPTLRLGVTGFAGSGKTVFITALVRNLVAGGRLPFFSPHAEGRIIAANLEPQPDDEVSRFEYETHLAALGQDPPHWPESTRHISELRISIAFSPQNRLRRMLGLRRLNIDIVDYPGEWLLDLAMLEKAYSTWSAEASRLAREPSQRGAAAAWLAFAETLDPMGPEDEQKALDGARLFTEYLYAARASAPLAALGPGRFLMPGDLEGSPLLTFIPLPVDLDTPPPRGSLGAMMARRFESYLAHVVRPFFRRHFSRLDRQIVLVDVLGALNGGAETVTHLKRALEAVLGAFKPGAASWIASLTGRRIDRLLFAATKADHIHHTSHDRLAAILDILTEQAGARASGMGADVSVVALASLRATREAEARDEDSVLPCIAGVPLAGETLAGKTFDGRMEAVIFPGDLPEDPRQALDGTPNYPSFPKFRPPRLIADIASGELPAPPHIRLDRALDFLIGDRLA